ncbi:NAD(P)H-binding protein [Pseudomonas sp. BGr12]|uniref:NAD(P)H-binding protein n=1 Tax=unclassified Pseudomonas TaxID=196821 RepID=UPI001782464D|nr:MULTISPECIES: NAD(P)H-binding protein [unclassified Pseudomonas]MBD9504975.1 NAD(P)H-binding protein [Pseudomonas sp. PDM17]MBD9577805.1 NAD(P)H-binding protein [Pseudomonas sp. PDM23]MBD9672363.1 NAD(P)H-binding protein [Pseudomonas sp. PDM21]MDL2430536.1 NAD(P)H-binding protein [Pseudomonas sp. BJa5]
MPTPDDQRKVLLAGATGLVGGQILQALLADASVCEVHALSRRPLSLSHPRLQVHIVDFSRLPALPPTDEAYLALGTTIKVAGSQAAFRTVDLDANLAVAKAALAAGVRRVGLVSAAGADARSSVFYNRIKGELEDALKAMELTALVIAQPSLLLDYRDGLQQPPRLGEQLAIPIAKLLGPLMPGKYRPVHARAVAQALVRTLPKAEGLAVLASNVLVRLGDQP